MNRFLVRVLNKLNWLQYLNIYCPVLIYKRKFYIPVLAGVGLESLPFEELWMCDLIEYGLSVKAGFFMDIGANIGQTLIKLRAVDENRSYVGFEPNPECIHYFNEVVKKNKFKNIDLLPVGLFERDSVLALKLYTDSSTDQGATLIENLRDGKIYGKINVPVFEYSHIANVHGLRDISMIKIDVEGAELEVLMSLKSNIIKYQPLILVEILPAYSKEYTDRSERQDKIGILMSELGYDIIRIHKDGPGRKVERLEKLAGFDIHGKIEYTDYVLVANSLSENILSHFNRKTS